MTLPMQSQIPQTPTQQYGGYGGGYGGYNPFAGGQQFGGYGGMQNPFGGYGGGYGGMGGGYGGFNPFAGGYGGGYGGMGGGYGGFNPFAGGYGGYGGMGGGYGGFPQQFAQQPPMQYGGGYGGRRGGYGGMQNPFAAAQQYQQYQAQFQPNTERILGPDTNVGRIATTDDFTGQSSLRQPPQRFQPQAQFGMSRYDFNAPKQEGPAPAFLANKLGGSLGGPVDTNQPMLQEAVPVQQPYGGYGGLGSLLTVY